MGDVEGRYTYKQLKEIADFLKETSKMEPKVGIICGSGLGTIADALVDPLVINYSQIPNFPRSTVKGHSGSLVFGCLSCVPVVVMKGRFHFYEGYPMWKVTMPCRIFKLLGCSYLFVSNAAGSINPKYKVGDIIVLRDHIYYVGLSGYNPLRGPNEWEFGPRFPPTSNCYDVDLRKAGMRIAKELGYEDRFYEGVYAALAGPSYESVAEARMLLKCGVDSVGMSTIPEVLVAVHCGLTVFGISIVTEEGNLEWAVTKVPNHLEVLAAAQAMEKPLREFVTAMVKFMGNKKPCRCGCC
ncbi:unnamed protein product [Phyllotreta striolata]|uniref:Purine nucleoside phosphorylase n=1 Tax=Phyllotreta striolata TaxID=444603 RepID=A0A9N9TYJ7_PHYSR|nr:unnamed protein product [Phyllotreta striolata]